ncbi:MAG: ribonuclease P protein component [Campylobacteraceae bacterium]|nr:ribonuclease P protein component [Campylobacteraceae bacterium]
MKKTSEFSFVYKNSKKWHNDCVVVFYNLGLKKKVGFTASKKVGNAVKRNLAKRRLRALFLELCEQIESGSYIFVAKQKIVDMDYESLKKSLIWSLKRLKCLKN